MSKKTEQQKMSEMVSGDNAQPTEKPDLPETVITPYAVQINKMTMQTGEELVLTNYLVPGHIYTIKLTEEQAKDLATGYNGGVEVARPSEISQILTP